jgi:hypothetical protein
MKKPMTEKEYRQLCEDMKSDMESDFPDATPDYYYDAAREALFQDVHDDKRLATYLRRQCGGQANEQILIECLADDIYSA